jgi:hypothetical protein
MSCARVSAAKTSYSGFASIRATEVMDGSGEGLACTTCCLAPLIRRRASRCGYGSRMGRSAQVVWVGDMIANACDGSVAAEERLRVCGNGMVPSGV